MTNQHSLDAKARRSQRCANDVVHQPGPRRFSRRLVAVTLLAGLAGAGCGNPQEVIDSNTVGSNARVGDVLLRNVHLVATEDPYQRGETATAKLMLFNEAQASDALVGVESPHARQVQMHWDRQCDGVHERVERIPLLPEGSVPNAPGQRIGGAPYHLEISDLSTLVRPGTTFPLTLTFERAGTTTIEAKVQATRDGDAPPVPPCRTAPAPTTPSPDPTQPPIDQRKISVIGTVEQGTEPDCLLLAERGRAYILLDGDPAVVHPGARVAVHGRLEPGTPAGCGHGDVLRVLDAIPFT
ncbi:copper chaperone PCu(A)C [Saccharopolyspora erythraea]|uniref:copper chaperone PCu(A)C n=1 Tax=Saccharopolyspora erythraea TaxID=1836 RepID=UPI001BADE174|nr:copper chaperone PCu(A)C [Saccharopolyspora erythraea]QUH04067.1 copper chaperone PCu(A)C [Saccharopolyspora erythraea]